MVFVVSAIIIIRNLRRWENRIQTSMSEWPDTQSKTWGGSPWRPRSAPCNMFPEGQGQAAGGKKKDWKSRRSPVGEACWEERSPGPGPACHPYTHPHPSRQGGLPGRQADWWPTPCPPTRNFKPQYCLSPQCQLPSCHLLSSALQYLHTSYYISAWGSWGCPLDGKWREQPAGTVPGELRKFCVWKAGN